MEKVEVVSSCLVGIANANNCLSRLELTPMDLQVILLDPIQKGLLFHNPKSQQIDDHKFINNIKHSLSRTLQFFPPLAGRLATTTGDDTTCFSIDCNNAGALFTHAVASTVSISDILEPTYVPEVVSSFFSLNGVCNYEGTSEPLLGVQVTELVDGVFIGVTANHAVVDGASFWHFFESWSEISRGLDAISKVPVFERLYSKTIHLPPLEKNPWKDFIAPPLLERVFHFSKESLAKLKADANAGAGISKISCLQALSAHLWRSSTRCRRLHLSHHDNSSSRSSNFIMMIGARERISFLREGYFGNANYAAFTAISEDEVLQKGLGYVARKINELVGEQTSESATKSWAENPVLYRKGGSHALIFTSSPRFNIYEVDFGWGKPIAARSGKMAKFDGKITLYPAAGAGGIDVEVSMSPEILQAMGDDPEFMEAIN